MADILARYDRRADVLYLSTSDMDADIAREDSMGIVWRYVDHDHAIGATIIDYHEIWADRIGELVKTLAQHLHVPERRAQNVLDSVDG